MPDVTFDSKLYNLQAKAVAVLQAWHLPISRLTRACPQYVRDSEGYYVSRHTENQYVYVEYGWHADTDNGEIATGAMCEGKLTILWERFVGPGYAAPWVATSSDHLRRLRIPASSIDFVIAREEQADERGMPAIVAELTTAEDVRLQCAKELRAVLGTERRLERSLKHRELLDRIYTLQLDLSNRWEGVE